MTLQEMAEAICTKVGQTDAQSQAACRGFLNARWRQVWDSAPWRESLAVRPAVTMDAEGLVLVPPGLERVLGVRRAGQALQPMELPVLLQYDATLWEASGEPCWFATLPPTVMPRRPAAGGEAVKIRSLAVSTQADALLLEAGKTVYLAGEDAQGEPRTETLTLEVRTITAGLTQLHFLAADGSYPLAQVTAFTAEPVGVELLAGYSAEEAGEPGQGRLPKGETAAPLLLQLRLLPAPAAGSTVLVLGKKRFAPLLEAQAQPALRGVSNLLLALATGDMLERQRQYAKAQLKFQEGGAQLALLLDLERNQSATDLRVIPAELHGAAELTGKGVW